MEAVFEILLEILLTVYYGIAVIVVPHRALKKWQRIALTVLSAFISTVAVAMIIAGPIMISMGTYRTAGIVLVVTGCLVAVVHITLFLIIRFKAKRRFTAKEAFGDECETADGKNAAETSSEECISDAQAAEALGVDKIIEERSAECAQTEAAEQPRAEVAAHND